MRGRHAFLALAASLSLQAGAIEAAGYRPFPGHLVDVVQDEHSHKLSCAVSRAHPPTKRQVAIVGLTVPEDFVLESAAVRTASGQSEAKVSSIVSWSGPYTLTIDAAEVECAASGSLVLVIHGDFTKETVICPPLPLFLPEACIGS